MSENADDDVASLHVLNEKYYAFDWILGYQMLIVDLLCVDHLETLAEACVLYSVLCKQRCSSQKVSWQFFPVFGFYAIITWWEKNDFWKEWPFLQT